MKFTQKKSSFLIPDGKELSEALPRTTHLAIAAHQDDLEILAYHGISTCFRNPDKHFTGVVVTDGKGSQRKGPYENCSDDEMIEIRRQEQEKAARLGEYTALFQLSHPSSAVKTSEQENIVSELLQILQATQPNTVYLHNLADKHDTHVAVATSALKALRQLPSSQRPQKTYGVEVWRDLDWLPDDKKQMLDAGKHPNLSQALMGVFDSQMTGWKRFDLGTLGRRAANATFSETHGTETSNALTYAMDLQPLIENHDLSPIDYTLAMIRSFEGDVKERLEKFI